MGLSLAQKFSNPPTAAWSLSEFKPVCVDCGQDAEVLIGYVLYMIGDVLCNLHGSKRLQQLGRGRINHVSKPIKRQLRLVVA